MHNGNFIRFKTLEIGYSFKFGRVYLNGDNIAVWSPFKLWDPGACMELRILCRVPSLWVYSLSSKNH